MFSQAFVSHSTWQGDVCMGGGGAMCGRGACMAGGAYVVRGGGMCDRGQACRRDGHWSGWYASYWDAFLLRLVSVYTERQHQCSDFGNSD